MHIESAQDDTMSALDGNGVLRQKRLVIVAQADVVPDVPSLLDTRLKTVAIKPPFDVDSDVL